MLNYTKDGQEFWVELSITPVADEQGLFTHWVSIQRNITERVHQSDELKALALFDPLTKLANRRLLDEHLEQSLIANRRNRRHGALIFIDLDNFKSLNDEHGHRAGDLCLIEVASRLNSCVRELDTVSRVGGDEFVVLLSLLEKAESVAQADALAVAEKIRNALSDPYLLEGKNDSGSFSITHHGSASIGVALFAGQEIAAEILKSADSAMYEAKNTGRNRVQLYKPK
jgi:diguanylate cyclase (GGDEF)-like protein